MLDFLGGKRLQMWLFFFWLRDTGVDAGLLLLHVLGTEEDVLCD